MPCTCNQFLLKHQCAAMKLLSSSTIVAPQFCMAWKCQGYIKKFGCCARRLHVFSTLLARGDVWVWACQHVRAPLPALEGSAVRQHATRKDSRAHCTIMTLQHVFLTGFKPVLLEGQKRNTYRRTDTEIIADSFWLREGYERQNWTWNLFFFIGVTMYPHEKLTPPTIETEASIFEFGLQAQQAHACFKTRTVAGSINLSNFKSQ